MTEPNDDDDAAGRITIDVQGPIPTPVLDTAREAALSALRAAGVGGRVRIALDGDITVYDEPEAPRFDDQLWDAEGGRGEGGER